MSENPNCEKLGCGTRKVWTDELGMVCPRNADAHALCAKLAAAEAKVRELERQASTGFVYDKNGLPYSGEDVASLDAQVDDLQGKVAALTAANAALEEKLAEVDFVLTYPGWVVGVIALGITDNGRRAVAACEAAQAREASRKKGAEHGE